MEQQGEYTIGATQQAVWEALNDPEVLGACIPGCVSVEQISETEFNAKVKAKIGPVSATFDTSIQLTDIDAPHRYTIEGAAKGGAAGFGKGTAQVELSDIENCTLLTYAVKASVGGKLAQIGSRLVDGAARKMADEFFAAFSAKLDPSFQQASKSADDTSIASSSEQPTSAPPEYEKSGNGFVWVIAFVVLAAAVILAL